MKKRLLVLLCVVLVVSLALTVTACAAKEYSLTFEVTGSSIDPIKVKAGETIGTLPAVPEKAGYKGEWQIDGKTIGADTIWNFDADKQAKASYTLITYTVTFKADGSTVGQPLTYTVENKQITPPQVPTKAGYNGEWETYTLTTGDVTVNAVYTAKTDTAYTVEHWFENLDGTYTKNAEKTQNLTGTTGATATAAALTEEGYTENTTHADRIASGTIAGDGSLVLKLYYSLPRVTVTFVLGGTSANIEKDVIKGGKVTAPAAEGLFQVEAWLKDDEPFNFDTPVTEPIELTAKYGNIIADFENGITWSKSGDAEMSEVTGDDALSGNKSLLLSSPDKMSQSVALFGLDKYDLTGINYLTAKVAIDYPQPAGLRIRIISDGKNFEYTKWFGAGKNTLVERVTLDFKALVNADGAALDKSKITAIAFFMDYKGTLVLDDVALYDNYNECDVNVLPAFDITKADLTEFKKEYKGFETRVSGYDPTAGTMTFKLEGAGEKKLQSTTYTTANGYATNGIDLTKYYAIKLKINAKDGAGTFRFTAMMNSGATLDFGTFDLEKGDNDIVIYLNNNQSKDRMVKNVIFYLTGEQYYQFIFSDVQFLIG